MKNTSFYLKPVLVLACLTFALSAVAGDSCCKKRKKASATNCPPAQVESGKVVKETPAPPR